MMQKKKFDDETEQLRNNHLHQARLRIYSNDSDSLHSLQNVEGESTRAGCYPATCPLGWGRQLGPSIV